jgi:hypothetical protein
MYTYVASLYQLYQNKWYCSQLFETSRRFRNHSLQPLQVGQLQSMSSFNKKTAVLVLTRVRKVVCSFVHIFSLLIPTRISILTMMWEVGVLDGVSQRYPHSLTSHRWNLYKSSMIMDPLLHLLVTKRWTSLDHSVQYNSTQSYSRASTIARRPACYTRFSWPRRSLHEALRPLREGVFRPLFFNADYY